MDVRESMKDNGDWAKIPLKGIKQFFQYERSSWQDHWECLLKCKLD
jgi:hypothetical protein